MRNPELWRPTKVELHRGKWRASRDVSEVGMASRLIVDLGVPRLAGLMSDYATGDVLDLGCGKVPFYGMYRDRAASVTCLDWGESLHSSPHIDVEADLSRSLPLPDASYDTVIATDVLEHLTYPDLLWAEMARVLRPGGRVILTVPFLFQLHEQPHDYHRYTIYRLRRFAVDHGFEVVKENAVGGAPVVFVEITLRIFGRFLPRPLHALVRRLAERVARRTRPETSWPLGYSLAAAKAV